MTRYAKVDAGASKTVTVRLATSLISLDQAKKNLAMEIPHSRTFDQVRDAAQDAWDQVLGRVEVEGATADQLTTLYSNLYRLYLYPNSAFENTGTAAAPKYQYASPVQPAAASTPTQTGAKIVDGKMYVNNGFWDTYRTTWPAYSLLTPNKAAEMVDGFAQQYRDGGWIARWSSPGYANLMTGTSSDVAFADAYTKGVPLKDVQSTYEAAVRNATVDPAGQPEQLQRRPQGPPAVDLPRLHARPPSARASRGRWRATSTTTASPRWPRSCPVSRRLDQATRDRYRTEAAYFLNRSQNYVKMFDPKVGFFQGFDANHVPSKTPGAVQPARLGWRLHRDRRLELRVPRAAGRPGPRQPLRRPGRSGRRSSTSSSRRRRTPCTPAATAASSTRWSRPATSGWASSGMSNQVSHHIPYMYDYAGQPSKTAEKVREIMSRLYSGSEIGQGYAGDEDNGETSAWWLFSAMGSTRCRWATATTPSGHRCSRR